MFIGAVMLIGGMFFADNAEFFAEAHKGEQAGKTWQWVGPETRNPAELAIPLINEETGKETILFRLTD
tara:strand:- start:1154 stop:1357 length:204 start_codon:yes stop_codon:yes gene_type:complete